MQIAISDPSLSLFPSVCSTINSSPSIRKDNLTLSLGKIENVEHYVEQLSTRSSVKKASIHQDDFAGDSSSCLPSDKLKTVFNAIGSLPQLQVLRFQWLAESDSMDSFYQALTNVLNNARNLVQLDLTCVKTGNSSNSDFLSFVDSLKNHTSIKEFKFSFSQITSGSSSLDSIVEALAVIPTIEKIQMQVNKCPTDNDLQGGLSVTSMQRLCEISNLKTLKIGCLELQEEHICCLSNALKENKSLTELRLWNCGINMQSGLLLSEMLKVNNALQQLDLSWNNFGDDGFIAIAESLQKNSTLQGLYLHKETISARSYQAVEQMLERNFSLTALWADFKDMDFSNKVQFYLRLNQTGRRGILRNTNSAGSDEWIDTLESQKDDLSTLFYYISTNSHVFC